jgi:shikimate dehydrogenase
MAATGQRTSAPSSKRSVLVGLIGSGIEGSRAGRLHEQEGEQQHLRYVYRLIDLDLLGLTLCDLPDLLRAAQRMGFDGLNVTHPCKRAVVSLLDELSTEARALRAVNTIVFADGRSSGHNTDWWGFAEAFRRELAGAPLRHVVQLGAGGAGSAVAHAVLTLGAQRLSIVDLDRDRAIELTRDLCLRFGTGRAAVADDAATAIANADGLINATPVGTTKHPGLPIAPTLLSPRLWVADIVYVPLETELLKAARTLGCRTMAGGGMAVYQAAAAFRLFTGVEADTERMLRHFASL